MKRFLQEYGVAWQTTLYFGLFWFLLAILLLPLQFLRLLDDEKHAAIKVPVVAACVLVYLPFAILWASRVSHVRPPTDEQADQLHREAVAAKNAELQMENQTVCDGASRSQSQT
jgi:hypothetical protein